MSRHIFKIEDGDFGLTVTDPAITDPCAATISPKFTDFTCQITSGALTASPNVTQETVPATWCDPEESIPQVGKTSYSLELSFLQDPDVVAGLSRFLFEHDTEEAWFFMGLNGGNPPKAVGNCRLVSGTIGGEARITLTATATLPVDGKPMVCFGTTASHAAVGGDVDPLNVTSTNLPNAATFANLTALKADVTKGDGHYTTPTFTTGQYVVLGDASHAHCTGTGGASVWSVGPTP